MIYENQVFSYSIFVTRPVVTRISINPRAFSNLILSTPASVIPVFNNLIFIDSGLCNPRL